MDSLIHSNNPAALQTNTPLLKACLISATLCALMMGCTPTEDSTNSQNNLSTGATSSAGSDIVDVAKNNHPLTPAQSQLYVQSCKNCHENLANPSPQSHDVAAWDARFKLGLPTLVQHSMQGFNAMPPGGLCAICTPADFEALIEYMAAPPP